MENADLAVALIEASMADAMAAIEAAEDVPEDKRRHWMCSLRIVAKALGKPSELLPARWTAVRIPISRLHHAQMGVTAKTLANHKSNVRAALSWFAKEEKVPLRGAPLSKDWVSLRDGVTHRRTRAHLSSPMALVWSARGIAPEEVDETALDACMAYRAATTALKANSEPRLAGSHGPGIGVSMWCRAGLGDG